MLTNELNPYGSKLKLSLLSTFDLPNVIKDSIHYISCRGFSHTGCQISILHSA